MAVYELNVSHPLLLRQQLSSNIKVLTVSSQLLLVDRNLSGVRVEDVRDNLTLRQGAVVGFAVYNGTVASSLTLTQATHPRVHVVSAISYLPIAHQAEIPLAYEVSSTLNLSHVLEQFNGELPSSSLTLAQAATVVVVRNFVIEQTLSLQSVGSGYLRNDPLFVTVPFTPMMMATGGTVKFVFGSTELVLPRPEPDNTLRLDFTRVNRRTRGGDLVVYAASAWPKTKTQNLTFTFFKEVNAERVKEFLKMTLGKRVEYHAHDGVIWSGFIMTPAAEVSHDTRMLRSVNIEFQGAVL